MHRVQALHARDQAQQDRVADRSPAALGERGGEDHPEVVGHRPPGLPSALGGTPRVVGAHRAVPAVSDEKQRPTALRRLPRIPGDWFFALFWLGALPLLGSIRSYGALYLGLDADEGLAQDIDNYTPLLGLQAGYRF